MKILKKGRKLSDKPQWVGKVLKCGHCGCRFKLELGDKVVHLDNHSEGNYFKIGCPGEDCNRTLSWSNT